MPNSKDYNWDKCLKLYSKYNVFFSFYSKLLKGD